MNIKRFLVLLIILSLVSCVPQETSQTDESETANAAFRDSVDLPPDGWNGPVFQMSDDYPGDKPDCAAPWLERNVDFQNPNPEWDDWAPYVQDIIDYIWEGQDPNLPDETGWRIAVNGNTRWYHVPWMAYDGERGREFAHGLTNELSTALPAFREGGRGSGKHVLDANADGEPEPPLFETWSVGMYNPCGAWSIGQSFPASGVPDTYTEDGRNFAQGMPFPDGTVVIKLLNTTADETAVPYMKGSTNWQANAHKQLSSTEYTTCEREVRIVHLVQVDIAVVDSRSPTRWVYSTLAYDGNLPGETVLDRLTPLGVQFGNDGGTFPAVPESESKALNETILAPVGIPEHYGCQKRLAGAVDQPNSSCVSCHMGAFAAPPPQLNLQGENVPAIFNFDGICTEFNEANADYFSDYQYPAPYPNGSFDEAIPLDSSLQLAVAFTQYANFVNPEAPAPTCPNAGSN
ncbi:MAG: hypothetical protein DWQ04_05750 [Chloroflexi bacterium]|nr:MAG: hypothetical protein DWQ04_05750 [Chloroflexota bacterium]